MQSGSTPSPLEIANDAWTRLFNSGPYTTFNMMNYLLHQKKVNWEQFLQEPDVLQNIAKNDMVIKEMARKQISAKAATAFTNTYRKSITKQKVEKFMRHDIEYAKGPYPNHFDTTWSLKTGRCTSFALGVVNWLERMAPSDVPDYWKFQFYDLSGHRVARCQKTGLLVDSSSRKGAIVLREDQEWLTFDGSDQSWKWSRGESKFRSGNKKVANSSTTLVRDNCMAICLTEVALKGDLICYFRSFENGSAQYHGMIKWKPGEKRLELSSNFVKKYVFHWNKTGTTIDQTRFAAALNDFIHKYGGPHGFLQWNSGSIHTINWDIWAAAVRVWGYPIEERLD